MMIQMIPIHPNVNELRLQMNLIMMIRLVWTIKIPEIMSTRPTCRRLHLLNSDLNRLKLNSLTSNIQTKKVILEFVQIISNIGKDILKDIIIGIIT